MKLSKSLMKLDKTRCICMTEKQEQDRQRVRNFISELTTERPEYVADAQKRAEKHSEQGIINCPMCVEGTPLDILHVLPPLNPDPTDETLDTDWHVRCPKCNHEAIFTMTHSPTMLESLSSLKSQRQIQQPKKTKQRKRRRKRKPTARKDNKMPTAQHELYYRFLYSDKDPIFSSIISQYNPTQMSQFANFIIDVMESEVPDEKYIDIMDMVGDRVAQKVRHLPIFQLTPGRATEILDEIKSMYRVCDLATFSNTKDLQQETIKTKKLMLKNAKTVLDKLKPLLSESDNNDNDSLETSETIQSRLKKANNKMIIPQYELYHRFLDFNDNMIVKSESSLNYLAQMYGFPEFIIQVFESKNFKEAHNMLYSVAHKVSDKVKHLQIYQLPAARSIEILDEIKSMYEVCIIAMLSVSDLTKNKQEYIKTKKLMLKNAKTVLAKLELMHDDELEHKPAKIT